MSLDFLPNFDDCVHDADSFYKFQRDISGVVWDLLVQEGVELERQEAFYSSKLRNIIENSESRIAIKDYEFPVTPEMIYKLWLATGMEKPVYLFTIFLASWLMSPSANPKRFLINEVEWKIVPTDFENHPIDREQIIESVLTSWWSIWYQAMSVDDYYDNGLLFWKTGAQIRSRKKTFPDFKETTLMTLKRRPKKNSDELRKIFEEVQKTEISDEDFIALQKTSKIALEAELYDHDPRANQEALAQEWFYITRSKWKLRDSLILPDEWFLEVENYHRAGLPLVLEVEWPNPLYIMDVAERLWLWNSSLYSILWKGSRGLFEVLWAENQYLNLNGDRIHDSLVWWKRDDMIRQGLHMIHEWYFK